MEDVAGSYSAIVFETTTDGSTTDQLAAGASISLVLAADETTTGQLCCEAGLPLAFADSIRRAKVTPERRRSLKQS